MGCDPQGGGTQPQPYKRPFPTKSLLQWGLILFFDLDSNDNLLGFTYHSSNTEYSIVYDNQSRIDSVYRILTAESLGTTGLIQPLTVSTCRFDDTTWDYDYGLRFTPTHFEYLSTSTSRDYEYELNGDTIVKSHWINNQTPYSLYRQEAFVLGDSINPLWIKSNPLFTWQYLSILDEVFSAKMPISRTNIGSNGGSIYDNFTTPKEATIERRASHSSGNTNTMELSY